MTPAQFTRWAESRGRSLEREQQQRAWAVWHIAALERVKKLPRFEKFAGLKSPKRRQSPEELEAAMRAFFGAPPEEA